MNTSAAPARVPAPAALLASPVIAVLRAPHAREYAPVVSVLAQAGIRSIELTLSTPETLAHFGSLRGSIPEDVELGVGTVTSMEDAVAALEAGASFLVTPVTNAAIVELALAAGVPVYPGGMTPTELHAGWVAGATAVKVFPASAVGPGYASQLRGPFPDIRLVPSGGVGIADIAPWMQAGATAVSLGGPLVGDAFHGGSLAALGARAEMALGKALEGLVH